MVGAWCAAQVAAAAGSRVHDMHAYAHAYAHAHTHAAQVAAAAGSRVHLFTLNGLLVWSWAITGAGVSAVELSPCGTALLCGFDDGSLGAWRLHDRRPLVQYVSAPAPIVCVSPAEGGLLVGTSRSDLVIYPLQWATADAVHVDSVGMHSAGSSRDRDEHASVSAPVRSVRL